MKARDLLPALLLAVACGAETPAPEPGEVESPAAEALPTETMTRPPDPAYLAEIESWRAERFAGLRRPDGWLSLAGLFWLEEGDSTVGSDPAADLVFPPSVEARLGVLRRSGRQVRFEAAEGAAVSLGGEPVTAIDLASDAGGEPTVLELGSLRFYVIERGERVGVRLKDLESELLREFDGIDHYPVDPAWRLEARFEPFPEPRMVPIPNITGDVNDQPSHGRVVFAVGDAEHALESLGEPAKPLFLVFGDETNGSETYGGGRFLYAGPPDAQGRMVVDFNQAYNPPCVFTPYATCPLPPPGNRLSLAVTAGEKSFGAGH